MPYAGARSHEPHLERFTTTVGKVSVWVRRSSQTIGYSPQVVTITAKLYYFNIQ
jgi:hypothetical protein